MEFSLWWHAFNSAYVVLSQHVLESLVIILWSLALPFNALTQLDDSKEIQSINPVPLILKSSLCELLKEDN